MVFACGREEQRGYVPSDIFSRTQLYGIFPHRRTLETEHGSAAPTVTLRMSLWASSLQRGLFQAGLKPEICLIDSPSNGGMNRTARRRCWSLPVRAWTPLVHCLSLTSMA